MYIAQWWVCEVFFFFSATDIEKKKTNAGAFVSGLQSQAGPNRSLLWEAAWRSNVPQWFSSLSLSLSFSQSLLLSVCCCIFLSFPFFLQKSYIVTHPYNTQTNVQNRIQCLDSCMPVVLCVCVSLCTAALCIFDSTADWWRWRWSLLATQWHFPGEGGFFSWVDILFFYILSFPQQHPSSAWCPKRLSMIYVNTNIKTDLVLSNRR